MHTFSLHPRVPGQGPGRGLELGGSGSLHICTVVLCINTGSSRSKACLSVVGRIIYYILFIVLFIGINNFIVLFIGIIIYSFNLNISPKMS